jgi:hypothetical protein
VTAFRNNPQPLWTTFFEFGGYPQKSVDNLEKWWREKQAYKAAGILEGPKLKIVQGFLWITSLWITRPCG